MHNSPLRFQKNDCPPALPVQDLAYYAQGWIVDGEIRQHSTSILTLRRMILDKVLWFLDRQHSPDCGTLEVRQFLAYLVSGHTQPGGRWGNPQLTGPVRPRTVDTYHSNLKTFFNWVVAEGGLPASPMGNIRAPVCKPDQIKPFTDEQLLALFAAARRTQNAQRNAAILWLLCDTGIRASELCGLQRADLDMAEKRITVLGKGNKRRSIYFGRQCAKALWAWLRGAGDEQTTAPLFPSERGDGKGEALSRWALGDLVRQLGVAANIQGVRCSPHTLRHTFAISFLRAGGQSFALREIMGHTNLKMTDRYVNLAQADLAQQRRFSPGDRLKKR